MEEQNNTNTENTSKPEDTPKVEVVDIPASSSKPEPKVEKKPEHKPEIHTSSGVQIIPKERKKKKGFKLNIKKPKLDFLKKKKKKHEDSYERSDKSSKKQIYKWLLIIPILLLVFGFVQIIAQGASTGDFVHKDVSLKGGMSMTVSKNIDSQAILTKLEQRFPEQDFNVDKITSAAKQTGIVIETDIDFNDKEIANAFQDAVILFSEVELDPKSDIDVTSMGSALGEGFFKEVIIAMIIALVLMGLVVFLYFRTFVPSFAVILAAVSDIIVTLAIVNLLGIRLSIAGIAAFLMLIGYSVDTDILLSTRMVKDKEGTPDQRMMKAMKTGLTMSFTTIAAVGVAFFVSTAPAIKQIMTVLLIGLIVDLINTWIQNAGILKWYLERKARKKHYG